MKKYTQKLACALIASSILVVFTQNAQSEGDKALRDYVTRPELAPPLPKDSDVIGTLGMPSKNQLPARKFRFLVWNLHKGTEETFEDEYKALSLNKDIVLNQEIFLDQKMSDLFNELSHFHFTTATSFFSGKEKIRTGVANISATKPVYTNYVRTETLEPVVSSPKVTLISSYPIRFSTKKLTVVNIHGINFVSTKSFQHELHRIFEQIKDIPSPLVFAGDFNTWNKDRMSILESYSAKLGLKHAQFKPDNRMTFNGYPLDHFLHTKDLVIKSARVDGFYRGSDHKPLLVDVEYTPPKEESPNQEMLVKN